MACNLKQLFILLFTCSFSLFSYSQKKPSEKNIHIDTAGQINIYGNGNVYIGTIVINKALQTKIFLLSATQSRDTDSSYITELSFGNDDNIPLFGVDLKINFSDAVMSLGPQGTMMNLRYGLDSGNSVFEFQASQINKTPGSNLALVLSFRSKTKVNFSIFGTDGSLKN